MLWNCGAGKDFWESLGLQGYPTNPSYRKSVLGVHQKDWCWNWNSNTLATWFEELTNLKRPWCWERLRTEGEGNDRGRDGWVASLTQWTWVWVYSGSWWCTGRPGVLQFLGSQRVRHDWATKLNWNELNFVTHSCDQKLLILSSYCPSEVKVLVAQLCLALCNPMTVAHKAPLPMEFSRQEYWSGFPSPGDLPNPGIEPTSPALTGKFFTTELPGKPFNPTF